MTENTQKISNALKALARDETKTSIIRETFKDIEDCRAAGITNKKIAQTLSANGLEIDEKSLASLLCRERARQKTKAKQQSTKTKSKSVEKV